MSVMRKALRQFPYSIQGDRFHCHAESLDTDRYDLLDFSFRHPGHFDLCQSAFDRFMFGNQLLYALCDTHEHHRSVNCTIGKHLDGVRKNIPITIVNPVELIDDKDRMEAAIRKKSQLA